MINSFKIYLFIFSLSFFLLQSNAYAQKSYFGGGAILSTHSNSVGVDIKSISFIDDNLSVNVDFQYHNYEDFIESFLTNINLNLHFADNENMTTYLLTGFSFHRASFLKLFLIPYESETVLLRDISLNLGGGTIIKLFKSLSIYFEGRFAINVRSDRYGIISTGVLFEL